MACALFQFGCTILCKAMKNFILSSCGIKIWYIKIILQLLRQISDICSYVDISFFSLNIKSLWRITSLFLHLLQQVREFIEVKRHFLLLLNSFSLLYIVKPIFSSSLPFIFTALLCFLFALPVILSSL